jgi:2-phospho-L-lactate guanylyltransferase
MSTALIPVKRLRTGKSRLVRDLDRSAVEKLTLAMLEDLVETLGRVEEVSSIAVVTPDEAVATAAESFGARPLVRPEPGLNPSLDAAASVLAAEGMRELLVMLGDVAGALPEDVSALFAALRAQGGGGVVLAPARDGGTGALLRSPHDAIPNSFGPESAEAHRELAARAGIPFRELALPSLAVDLDCREDLLAFLARPRGGPRTRAFLYGLGLEPW